MGKIIISEKQLNMLKETKIINDDDFVDENKKSIYGVWKKKPKTVYKSFGQMSWNNKKSWSR